MLVRPTVSRCWHIPPRRAISGGWRLTAAHPRASACVAAAPGRGRCRQRRDPGRSPSSCRRAIARVDSSQWFFDRTRRLPSPRSRCSLCLAVDVIASASWLHRALDVALPLLVVALAAIGKWHAGAPAWLQAAGTWAFAHIALVGAVLAAVAMGGIVSIGKQDCATNPATPVQDAPAAAPETSHGGVVPARKQAEAVGRDQSCRTVVPYAPEKPGLLPSWFPADKVSLLQSVKGIVLIDGVVHLVDVDVETGMLTLEPQGAGEARRIPLPSNVRTWGGSHIDDAEAAVGNTQLGVILHDEKKLLFFVVDLKTWRVGRTTEVPAGHPDQKVRHPADRLRRRFLWCCRQVWSAPCLRTVPRRRSSRRRCRGL